MQRVGRSLSFPSSSPLPAHCPASHVYPMCPNGCLTWYSALGISEEVDWLIAQLCHPSQLSGLSLPSSARC